VSRCGTADVVLLLAEAPLTRSPFCAKFLPLKLGESLPVEHAERLGARLPKHVAPALGLIETGSIAKGYEVADAVVKVSPVRLLWARTASPGSS